MLVRVEVRTRQGALLDLPFEDPSSGLAITEIEGLSPTKATMVSTSYAQGDGEQYHSSRREPRDIKIKMDLNPDYVSNSVEDLRNRLYSFLMPKSEVMLRFHKHTGLYVDIWGRVETFDAPIFTAEPTADVSLRCFNPDFFDPNPVPLSGTSTELETETLFTYVGSVDTGVTFELRPNRDISTFTIYHRPPDGTLRTVDFAYPMVADDKLRISSVFGAKSVTLIRGGVETSVLHGLSPQSDWLKLQPGNNNLRVYATGLPVPYTLSFLKRYGGL